MNFIKACIGEQGFIVLIGLILVISGLAFFYFILRKNSLGKALVLFLVIGLGLFLTWQLRLPEEKIHILEYAVLGWLATRDLFIRDIKDNKAGVAPAAARLFIIGIFVFSVGLLDEIFQGILPYRYFQWSDIMLNGCGGAWGAVLYLLD